GPPRGRGRADRRVGTGAEAHTCDAGRMTSPAHQVPDGDAGPDRCGHLLGRIREGDDAAFELLFREYGGVMLAAIVRIVRDRSLGEEVLQECFTEIWRRASAFEP